MRTGPVSWDRLLATLLALWLIAMAAVFGMLTHGEPLVLACALLAFVTAAALARPIALAGLAAAVLATVAYVAVFAVQALDGTRAATTVATVVAALFGTGLIGEAVAGRLVASEQERRQAEQLIDALTLKERSGVFKENQLRRVVAEEVSRARRYRRVLTLIAVGVADWPELSAAKGEAAAEALVEGVAASLPTLVRDVDRVGRLSPRDFAVLLPETGLDGAQAVAEQIGAAAREQQGVTIRCGAAVYPDDAVSAEELIREAIAALDLAQVGKVTIVNRAVLA